MKNNVARISTCMKKHCVGTIGPPDFAFIAHSFVHACAQTDDDSENNSEEEGDVYDVHMHEYVPSSLVTKRINGPRLFTR